MKCKKLWAMLLVFALLIPIFPEARLLAAKGDVEYWENIVQTGDLDRIYNVQTTDELSDTNTTSTGDKRISGKPTENVNYVVVSDYDYVSNSYYEFDEISGGAYNTPVPTYYSEPTGSYYTTPTPTVYDEPTGGYYVTAAPTPTVYDEPTGSYYVTTTPTPYQNPTTTPEPTAKPTPYQNPTPTPAVTTTPTPYQNPTITPKPTAKPTPYQNPTYIPIVKPDPQGTIYVTPIVRTPEKKTYNVDLEVGRLAHIKPEKATQDTRKSSNTGIINDPRLATGSFNIEYEARANKPGTATLTFGTSSEAFTEEWNVNVFCRPLDFEKTEYVVEKKSGKDGYITLYLKNFEYEYEYAYDFKWESSDTKVGYIAGATTTTTFARICVKKPGVTIITVKDKYGNSSQCALIVKDADVAKATPTATPKPTKTPKPTTTPTPTEEPLADGITEKQIKKMVKESTIDLKVTSKDGVLALSWDSESENDLVSELFLDGYQVQVKLPGSKKYKTIKTLKSSKKVTFNFKDGTNKKNYVFRVRGYHINQQTGKKVYTKWSYTVKAKFKTKK